MISLQSGLRIYLACGVTDMRKGLTGLAMLVQQELAETPFEAPFMHSGDAGPDSSRFSGTMESDCAC